MGKALPEDVPIEAKMVTKAIERAQTTVEARNAEIRKNVLKYDEVMNEQRKVIYRRRQQILDGRDLRDEVLEQLKEAVEHTVQVFCATPYPEEWDLVGLLAELLGYYPTRFSVDDLRQAATPEQITESVLADAVAHYEEKEGRVGADTMRELERRVVLSIIDQRWREHLYEMDYLQEGINLRAMGQRDPLTEWQREGHEMFSQMMAAIDDDFVRYVLHAEVAVEAPRPSEPAVRNVQYSAPEDPSQAPSGFQRAAVAEAAAMGEVATAAPEAMGNGQVADDLETQAPIVKSEWEKTGRNQPCPCGSGKKFKLCHGA
jgi:preprotein translocase subunit SecA